MFVNFNNIFKKIKLSWRVQLKFNRFWKEVEIYLIFYFCDKRLYCFFIFDEKVILVYYYGII